MLDIDVEAVLATAPLKPDLHHNAKNCLRIDLEAATPQQMQAELLRLDEVLTRYHHIRNKAENDYKAKKRLDPAFRAKAAEANKAYRARLKDKAAAEKTNRSE